MSFMFFFIRSSTFLIREILKKKERKAKNSSSNFFKFEKNIFRYSHEECYNKVSKLLVKLCGYNKNDSQTSKHSNKHT